MQTSLKHNTSLRNIVCCQFLFLFHSLFTNASINSSVLQWNKNEWSSFKIRKNINPTCIGLGTKKRPSRPCNTIMEIPTTVISSCSTFTTISYNNIQVQRYYYSGFVVYCVLTLIQVVTKTTTIPYINTTNSNIHYKPKLHFAQLFVVNFWHFLILS